MKYDNYSFYVIINSWISCIFPEYNLNPPIEKFVKYEPFVFFNTKFCQYLVDHKKIQKILAFNFLFCILLAELCPALPVEFETPFFKSNFKNNISSFEEVKIDFLSLFSQTVSANLFQSFGQQIYELFI